MRVVAVCGVVLQLCARGVAFLGHGFGTGSSPAWVGASACSSRRTLRADAQRRSGEGVKTTTSSRKKRREDYAEGMYGGGELTDGIFTENLEDDPLVPFCFTIAKAADMRKAESISAIRVRGLRRKGGAARFAWRLRQDAAVPARR